MEEGTLTDDIIGMDDMMAIYEVTDLFGIDRESISVPLDKEGMGGAATLGDGTLEIRAPSEAPTRDWLPILRKTLEGLGYDMATEGDEWGA